jgi:hypothetical protein
MDWILFFIFVAIGVFVFITIQLAAILFLLTENKRIGEQIEKNEPPF